MPGKAISYPVTQPDTLLPFLLSHIKGKSRNSVKAILARGQVSIDGVDSTRFDYPLLPGATVTVAAPGARDTLCPFPLLYEDRDLIVIDKPAGLLTIATEREKVDTAYHLLTDCLRARIPSERLFIVHRLDRDTSGVLLFAKDEALKHALQDRWDELVTRREYLAVVEGVPEERSGTVRSFLHETKTHLIYSAPGQGGKEAVTHYETLQENGKYALLSVDLDSGRKNQIRVHMNDIGHPVAGDKQYGGHPSPMGRLGLHAHCLAFHHPDTGESLSFIAPVPDSFRALLRR